MKLVASSKPELKKLVYVYLERYAEEQQDVALLSISTFQRGLKDHNQVRALIRNFTIKNIDYFPLVPLPWEISSRYFLMTQN